ncbi:MAG: hypothetical protein HMLKMBBP_02904 [Planctomycetes bacterium]|nr:hypothetical protein [Planctomycetota bacterium]
MTIRRAVLPALLLAGALAALPPLPAFAGDDEVLDAVFGRPSEADGNFDAWLGELVAAVAADPQSPYAMAAIRKIHSIHGSASNPEVIEQKLAPLVAGGGLADGEADEAVRRLLAARAAARGDHAAAESLGASAGYLTRFAAAGPFGWDDATQVHRVFGPESRVLDPKADWEGSVARARWTELPETTSGSIDASTRIRGYGSGVTYFVCRVKSAKAQDVALKCAAGGSFAVLVNGRRAALADRGRDWVPGAVWCDAHLVEGWNRILVKVVGRGSFSVKACDPANGKPLPGLEHDATLSADGFAGPHADPGPAPSPRAYRTPTERALAAVSAGKTRAAAAGLLAQTDGLTWESWSAWKSAVEGTEPAKGSALDANLAASYGRVLAEFAPFPQVQRKLQAKKEFEKAVAAWPHHASATVRLADYDNEDDRPDRALKSLQSLAKEKPSAFAWMSLARIAKARRFDAEALDAAKRAHAMAPRNDDALDFLVGEEQSLGDFAEVERLQRLRLANNASDRNACGWLVWILRAQGRHDDALKLLGEYAARWPAEHGWRRQIADVHRALGRYDEALKGYDALAADLPLDASLLRAQAEILEIRADVKGAEAKYEASLAVDGAQPAVRRALARLRGKDDDLGLAWEPDAQELVASVPATEALKAKYPKAVAVTVLDHTVTRVHADGTSQSWVHMVYKLLDEKGVAKYESMPNAGENLLVRAILPDGRVMMPTGMQGAPYNMEGLVPGTLLEQRYTVHERATPRGWSGDRFFFQDFEFDNEPNPVLLSRLVVVAPEGMKLSPRARNMGGTEPRVETRDGWTSTVWEKRDVPRIDPEENMPERDEIVPSVDYSIPERFDDMAWEVFAQRADTRGSPVVDDALANCVRPGMSDLEKARAIHAFVNEEVKGNAGSVPGAAAILMEKSGNRFLLLQAMLRAAGVPWRAGRAMAWNGVGRSVSDLGSNAFDEPFILLEPAGAEPMPLFRDALHSPFGLVPEAYRGAAALVADERGGEIIRLGAGGPPIEDTSDFTVRLGPDPAKAEVEGALVFRNSAAYNAKRSIVEAAQDNRKKSAERSLAPYFVAPKLESFEFPRVEEKGVPYEVRLKGTMSNYLTQQGGIWTAPLGLPKANFAQSFVDKAERVFDLVIRWRDDQYDAYTIDLGEDWDVVSLPADHIAVDDLATYSLTWRRDGSKIRVKREYHVRPARYHAADVKRLAEWCKAVDDAEDRKLELRKVR